MTATIDHEGFLTITPSEEIEQYALAKWLEDNKSELTDKCKLAFENKF